MGHGSPDPDARAELLELGRLTAARLTVPVGLGGLEFPDDDLPDLESALALLAGSRARTITAQPLLLFDGAHGQRDMPEVVAGAAARAGGGGPLGQPLRGGPPPLRPLVGRPRAAGRGP